MAQIIKNSQKGRHIDRLIVLL